MYIQASSTFIEKNKHILQEIQKLKEGKSLQKGDIKSSRIQSPSLLMRNFYLKIGSRNGFTKSYLSLRDLTPHDSL